jgi:predicted amidohydrolase YtcJ
LLELDHAAGGRPLLLADYDQSLLVLNSAALRLCRIEAGDRKAQAQGVEKDERGEPSGRLHGPAARGHLAAGVVPPVNAYVRLARMRALLADIAQRGVTEVHDIATYPCDTRPLQVNLERSYTDMALVDALQARGELPVRVGYRPPLQRVADHAALTAPHAEDDMVFPAGYKLFLDDGWYAAVPPLRHDEYRYPGASRASQLIREAESRGSAVSVHACGDLGVAEALRLLAGRPEITGEHAGPPARDQRPRPPHRIVHARTIRPRDIQLCAQQQVVIETQPWQVVGLATFLSEPGSGGADPLISPYASLIRAGVTVAFSSDRRAGSRPDLLDADPLTGIQVAMTRRWRSAPQQPEQRLSAGHAFGCATRSGAIAGGNARRRGSLRAGADADLVILDGDPWRTGRAGIARLRVLATITAGHVVHDTAGIFA